MFAVCGGTLALWWFGIPGATAGPRYQPGPTVFNSPTRSDPVVAPNPPQTPAPQDGPPTTVLQAIDALRSPSAARQREGAEFLATAPPTNDRGRAASDLSRLLKSSDPRTAAAAARALARWAGDEEVDALVAALTHAEPEVRAAAITALGTLKADRSVGPLVARLADARDHDAADKVLAAFGGPTVVAELTKAASARDRNLRNRAHELLRRLGKLTPEVEAARHLATLQAGGNPFDESDAARQLARMTPTAPPNRTEIAAGLLATLKKTTDARVATEAGAALGVWGTDEDVPALLGMVDLGPAAQRQGAVAALAKLKDPRGAAAVARLLKEPGERFRARSALTEMGPVAEEGLWPLFDTDDDAMLRDVLLTVLRVGTARSVEPLRKLKERLDGSPARKPLALQADATARSLQSKPYKPAP
jgi:HEAT repeat protein